MKEASIKGIWHRSLLGLGLVLAVILLSHGPLYATAFTWSGLPIQGSEDPLFLPYVSADFVVDGSTLTITLTNTTPQTIDANWQVLTGVTWDIGVSGVVLDPVSAMISGTSFLVFPDGSPNDYTTKNMTAEWFYKDNISAENLGLYGIGTIGDINYGEDTFGRWDRFDVDRSDADNDGIYKEYLQASLYPPDGPNGLEVGILGPNYVLGGGLMQGPLVYAFGGGQTVFTFNIVEGALAEANISNVQPLFGTDGATPVPEPVTVLLLGTGLVGLVGFRKKLKK
ncbi:MAG: PEP-CTERM sorting domain-containing protein [Deltaproteobacteria bacterium]|nr:PEP-CTERM sorting domain-containing protein [Deltaproteobacteria bacterium]